MPVMQRSKFKPNEIALCAESFGSNHTGTQTVITAGTRLRGDHPLVRACSDFFVPDGSDASVIHAARVKIWQDAEAGFTPAPEEPTTRLWTTTRPTSMRSSRSRTSTLPIAARLTRAASRSAALRGIGATGGRESPGTTQSRSSTWRRRASRGTVRCAAFVASLAATRRVASSGQSPRASGSIEATPRSRPTPARSRRSARKTDVEEFRVSPEPPQLVWGDRSITSSRRAPSTRRRARPPVGPTQSNQRPTSSADVVLRADAEPRLEVHLSRYAKRAIVDACWTAMRTDRYETGGWLWGPPARAWNRTLVVERATVATFERGRDFTVLDYDELLREHEQHVRNDAGLLPIGEWHSHPSSNPRPSRPDLDCYRLRYGQANAAGVHPGWLGVIAVRTGWYGWTRPALVPWLTREDCGRLVCEPARTTT